MAANVLLTFESIPHVFYHPAIPTKYGIELLFPLHWGQLIKLRTLGMDEIVCAVGQSETLGEKNEWQKVIITVSYA